MIIQAKIPASPFAYIVTYFVAMNALMFTNMFLTGNRLGTVLLMPLAAISLFLAVLYVTRHLSIVRPHLSWLDLLVLAYLIYSAASIVLYFQPGNPALASAYLYGCNLQIVPMLLYFAGKGLSPEEVHRVLKYLVFLHVIMAATGVLLFFARPDFYASYVQDSIGFDQEAVIFARLQSYVGSTAAGILSAVTIVLLLNVRMVAFLRYMLIALLLFTILLAQQRGAYVTGVCAAVYVVWKSRVRLSHILLAAVAASVLVLFLLGRFGLTTDVLTSIVGNRVVADLVFGNPLGERLASYEKGFTMLSDFPLGLGLGATTSRADDVGANIGGQVVDAYFLRVACDLGVAGVVLFALLLLVGFLTGLGKYTFVGLHVIVGIYVLQSTGTNVLDTFYVSHVFWLLLGLAGAKVMPRRARAMSPTTLADVGLVPSELVAR